MAVNDVDWFTDTFAAEGETKTVIAGAAVMVMAELADFVVSVTDVAVNVTVAGLGTEAGAVYVTELAVMLLRVPQVVPEQPPPVRLHVTPLF